MDRRKGHTSPNRGHGRKAETASAKTKTQAHADIAQGKDPKEPPAPGQPPRHTPGATK
ncbi:hypothetical protein AA13594_1995 [Gluconacetobacter azotocaptans DSM 13594]|nr:hypothetical protein AA13594_1995 [Gluconacetobacter azotocaptans DSM 13594]